jgi:hypothetical protein
MASGLLLHVINKTELNCYCYYCLDNVGSLTSHNPIGLHGLFLVRYYFMRNYFFSSHRTVRLSVSQSPDAFVALSKKVSLMTDDMRLK